jgi:hypothetical protein
MAEEEEVDPEAIGEEELQIDGDAEELEAALLEGEEVPVDGEGLDEPVEETFDEGEEAKQEEEVPGADQPDSLGPAVPDEEEVSEHLRDAIEGSWRLKRYLSEADAENGSQPASKAPRLESPEAPKITQLMMKWRCPQDTVVRYALEQATAEEIDIILNSGYILPLNLQRAPADLLGKYLAELRERSFISRGSVDAVTSFRSRWKLGMETDKILRDLTHRDLRYVISKYDGNTPLDDVISDAANMDDSVEDEPTAENALPHGPGPTTLGRFNRLELIDPLADCAVFGDANLTFALRLAAHRKSLAHVGRVIATTFEELDTLRERYKEIDESITTLEDHYAEVYHGVDCTKIAIDKRFQGLEGALGAVYYNFPHSGAVKQFFDGHPIVNWRHENLMRLFFRALRSYVKPGGVVKIASNMNAVGVRYSYIIGSALENEFVHTETMPFMEWHMHRYGRSYGDRRDSYKRPDAKNNQSYNAQRAEADMVYCFRYEPSGNALPAQTIRYPPTLKTLLACVDGPFKGLFGPAKEKEAKSLHERFLSEISGVHIG